MPKRSLKFLQYSIHAHIGESNPDYANLIRELAAIKGKYRKSGKRILAIGTVKLTRAAHESVRLFLIVYSGDYEQNILLFDLNQQAEFTAQAEDGRFVARKTHVMIDPNSRKVLIESGRGHPPAEELAEFIEEEAQGIESYEGLELSFTPVPTRTFSDKISEMQRIQSATVSLARPNVDWNERHAELTQFAEESNAKVIDTTVRAGRNQSLAKNAGLIQDLLHWVSDTLPSVVNAKIKGSRDAQSPLIELKLSDHVETVVFPVDLDPATRQPLENLVQERLNAHFDRAEAIDD